MPACVAHSPSSPAPFLWPTHWHALGLPRPPCPALPCRLAAPLGVCSVVGVGGLALNGGLSLLSRAVGATADNILEATMVLADGSVVRVPALLRLHVYWHAHTWHTDLPGNEGGAKVMMADWVCAAC